MGADRIRARKRVAEAPPSPGGLANGPTGLTLKDLDPSERPRERLMERGADALSTTELLAILLRTGVAGLMVTDLARELLQDYSGLTGLAAASPQQIALRKGLGPAKVAQLKAALEIGRRLMREDLVDAGRLLDVDVLDHVVIGRGRHPWVSLRQRGLGFRS